MKSGEKSTEKTCDILLTACSKALRILSYKERSRRDLFDRLVAAGFPADTSEAVVGDMEERGFVNDKKMAEGYVSYAVENKHYGKYRILQDLAARKIDGETAREAYDSYMARHKDEDEDTDIDTENALFTLQKRMRQTGIAASCLDGGDMRRLTGYLHRRGFSFETIRKAFAKVCEEEHEE